VGEGAASILRKETTKAGAGSINESHPKQNSLKVGVIGEKL